MNNLFLYGCSNSVPFSYKTKWAEAYVQWKGYVPEAYGDIISRELKLNQINYSKPGTNNYEIFQKICDTFDEVNENDLIIIQWTQISRFRLVNKNNEWENFYADVSHYTEKIKNCDDVSKSTISEILINRTLSKHVEEIKSWEKLLRSNFKNNKLLFWSPFENIPGHGNILKSLETIAIETNGTIADPHFNERGQNDLAMILLNWIGENKKNVI